MELKPGFHFSQYYLKGHAEINNCLLEGGGGWFLLDFLAAFSGQILGVPLTALTARCVTR